MINTKLIRIFAAQELNLETLGKGRDLIVALCDEIDSTRVIRCRCCAAPLTFEDDRILCEKCEASTVIEKRSARALKALAVHTDPAIHPQPLEEQITELLVSLQALYFQEITLQARSSQPAPGFRSLYSRACTGFGGELLRQGQERARITI